MWVGGGGGGNHHVWSVAWDRNSSAQHVQAPFPSQPLFSSLDWVPGQFLPTNTGTACLLCVYVVINYPQPLQLHFQAEVIRSFSFWGFVCLFAGDTRAPGDSNLEFVFWLCHVLTGIVGRRLHSWHVGYYQSVPMQGFLFIENVIFWHVSALLLQLLLCWLCADRTNLWTIKKGCLHSKSPEELGCWWALSSAFCLI